MTMLKPLATIGAAAALVGTIALAYAQTTQPSPAPGTPTTQEPARPGALPSDSTSASPAAQGATSPSTSAPAADSSTTSRPADSGSTSATPDSAGSAAPRDSGMTDMREPKPDRN